MTSNPGSSDVDLSDDELSYLERNVSAGEATSDAQDFTASADSHCSQATIAHRAHGSQFPNDVTQVLESYYARGMRGWGKQHSADIASACKATGQAQTNPN